MNQMFTRHGFYPGFADLLWAVIISDNRSTSDLWLLSVFVKLASMGITDSVFVRKIEMLIDQNIDRYLNTTLVKLSILLCSLHPENPKYRELVLKRLRSLNPENNPQLHDLR